MTINPLHVPVLPAALVQDIRDQIPHVAEITVATVAAEVPAYALATQDPYRTELEAGVRIAFEQFAGLFSDPEPEALARSPGPRGRWAVPRPGAGAASVPC